jgi:hypothetical protein
METAVATLAEEEMIPDLAIQIITLHNNTINYQI